MGFLLGLCAFALFFLNDYNDWRLGRRALKLCFPAGGLLLLAGTLLRCGNGNHLTGWLRVLLFAAAAGWLLLLVYTLFFAIPLEASYARVGEKRRACTVGVYALCRHPGVLWFAGLYVCLSLAAGLPWLDVVSYCILNVLLVCFEDRCVFPALLEGYGAYQETTPFLIPDAASVKACLKRAETR